MPESVRVAQLGPCLAPALGWVSVFLVSAFLCGGCNSPAVAGVHLCLQSAFQGVHRSCTGWKCSEDRSVLQSDL